MKRSHMRKRTSSAAGWSEKLRANGVVIRTHREIAKTKMLGFLCAFWAQMSDNRGWAHLWYRRLLGVSPA